MKSHTLSWIEEELSKLREQGLYNVIKTIESDIDSTVVINRKNLLNFSSNNYLGLANDKKLKMAAKRAIDKYGVGPAAVRTIAGTTKLHADLEKALAKFKKTEAVITFQSGFMANLAVVPALVGEEDVIFSDELNHASIIDACRLSKARVVRYGHANTDDLFQKIKKTTDYRRGIIITDGVFSMDGDIAPLPALVEIAEKHNLLLMVDDAHGEGVLGSHGRGIVDHFKLHGRVDVEVGTMSKAFGVVGGFVAGKQTLIDWLRQRGRPFLFSSAMTIPDVAACLAAVKILTKSDKLTKRLWENANYFSVKMKALGFDIGNSQTPIVPIMLGEAILAREFSKELLNRGLFAMPIAYPTVPQGKARIRVMNSAAHTKRDIDRAVKIFETVGKKLKVIS
ncbi:8-amino-7-oxononanoate synthase [Candidatus Woesebacteria bacterium RIFCSPHIGHO2_01_FULL_41_10]|uniref:8-amino-7-ketopelargonate synthase n=1 Tax=Candidatus Woesebacteria bacterium RIFCSPHIGHO2_01_FULL_41_10 TaxID=1802500 RepID=A0A1F7YPA9_9BACT|nr:MAG: 8-amino-7-oxononanoate synthase [Candidatus Woesebacteria bacterium RIFCSPHIGHO2_01_FULL_41_10]